MTTLTIILIILTIIIGAMSDGFNDSKKKVVGHILAAVETLGLICIGALVMFGDEGSRYWFIERLILIVLSYGLIRAALFDFAYNLSRGISLFYLGDSSLWDRFMKKFPPSGVTFARFVFILIGIFIIINEL